jgi:uncharacterized protein with PIN domain
VTPDRVRCPRCGREYDADLFAFGRTRHCTCGARVGLEPAAPQPAEEHEPRFLADAMLGRLARWLRLLGFDVLYDAAIEDAEVARRALEERRIVLTRDRALPEEWRLPRVVVLRAETTGEQLRELARVLPLRERAQPFTRCSRCNGPLDAVPAELVAARIPPHIAATQSRFLRCRGCGHVYWEGSHVARIRRTLDEVLGEA